jgi:hypothetical protein
MRRIVLISFWIATLALGDLSADRWPAAIRDLPQDNPVKVRYRGCTVEVAEPSDASVRAGGGSAGPMLTFTIRTSAGHATSFDEQSIGARLLEFYRGYPQLEIWTRAGGDNFTRGLHRFTSGKYRCVRLDDFTRYKSAAKNPAVVAILPDSTEKLYFVATRTPDDD